MAKSEHAVLGIAPAAAIVHARALLDTAPARAEAQAREVLKVLPNDARAMAVIAAARRRLGLLSDALALSAALLQQRPDLFELQVEAALVRITVGDRNAALDLLRDAARRNVAAWTLAASEFVMAGDPDGAAVARLEALRPGLADNDLRAACDALRAGRLRDAAVTLEAPLRRKPSDRAARDLLIRTAAAWHAQRDQARLADAPAMFSGGAAAAAIADLLPGLQPCDPVRLDYAAALLAIARPEDALAALLPFSESGAEQGARDTLLAHSCLCAGDMRQAAALSELLTARFPGHAHLWRLRQAAAQCLGCTDIAAAAAARAEQLRPGWTGLPRAYCGHSAA